MRSAHSVSLPTSKMAGDWGKAVDAIAEVLCAPSARGAPPRARSNADSCPEIEGDQPRLAAGAFCAGALDAPYGSSSVSQ